MSYAGALMLTGPTIICEWKLKRRRSCSLVGVKDMVDYNGPSGASSIICEGIGRMFELLGRAFIYNRTAVGYEPSAYSYMYA